jgi:hypothetical protein
MWPLMLIIEGLLLVTTLTEGVDRRRSGAELTKFPATLRIVSLVSTIH